MINQISVLLKDGGIERTKKNAWVSQDVVLILKLVDIQEIGILNSKLCLEGTYGAVNISSWKKKSSSELCI